MYQTPIRRSKIKQPENSNGEPSSSAGPKDYKSQLGTEPRTGSSKIKIQVTKKDAKPYQPISEERAHERDHPTYQQMQNLIQMYQTQIQYLKEYIHKSDLVQRGKIIDIFGFNYTCCNGSSAQQCKLVLKQLTTKVKQLIVQNNKLKCKTEYGQKQKQKQRPSIDTDDQLLIKQNERLRKIIDELKDSQDSQANRTHQQKSQIKMQNDSLKELNKKYKNRIQALQENAQYRKKKQAQNWSDPNRGGHQMTKKQPIYFQPTPVAVPRSKPVIQQIKPIKYDFNTPHPQDEEVKQQLRKQVWELKQKINKKNEEYEQTVMLLNQKIQQLQNRCKEYQKQRGSAIESSVNKPIHPTINTIQKPRGDGASEYTSNRGNKDNRNPQMQYKTPHIKHTNIRQQVLPDDANKNKQSPYVFLKRGETGSQPKEFKLNPGKGQVKVLQQKLAIEQMKNKNNAQQINLLNSKLNQLEQKIQRKVLRNMELQKAISKLQQQKTNTSPYQRQHQIEVSQLQKEVQLIKQSLKECQIPNLQQLFKDFHEVLNQRNYLARAIERYKASKEKNRISRQRDISPQQKEALMQKMNLLDHQNKELYAKVSKLKAELQDYYNQSLNNNQDNNLYEINLSSMREPTDQSGRKAFNKQQEIQNCIQSNLVRLEKVKNKIEGMVR